MEDATFATVSHDELAHNPVQTLAWADAFRSGFGATHEVRELVVAPPGAAARPLDARPTAGIRLPASNCRTSGSLATSCFVTPGPGGARRDDDPPVDALGAVAAPETSPPVAVAVDAEGTPGAEPALRPTAFRIGSLSSGATVACGHRSREG